MKEKIQKVLIDSLVPNSWNTNVVSPDNQLKIETSIKRFGMFKPLVCRTLDNGQIEIIGGQHRWEAAKSLGFTEVSIVNLGVIGDSMAKEISLVDNGRYGSDDVLRLNDLLRELGDITEFTPFTDSDITQLTSSATIDLDAIGVDDSAEDIAKQIEDLVKNTPTYQVMRFKVPLDDVAIVEKVINKIINKQGFTDSDSLTNAGDALVHLCATRG